MYSNYYYPYQTVGLTGLVPSMEPTHITIFRSFISYFLFGFTDNFFMISFADVINTKLMNWISRKGASPEKQAHLAAGWGNLGSDMVGLGLGDSLGETLTNFFFPGTTGGLPNKTAQTISQVVGIGVGCWMGMHAGIWLAQKRKTLEKMPSGVNYKQLAYAYE